MKTIYKVEQSDLVGSIKDFPIEVAQKMVEEQVAQGNRPNVKVFQDDLSACAGDDGFTWSQTDDGDGFWIEVLDGGNFDLFFEKYPKKNNTNLVYIVGDSEVGMDIIKTLEKYGGINKYGFDGSSDDCVYYIEPNTNLIKICDFDKKPNLWEVLMATYTPIDAEECILEVTMEEIAEKFGINVTNLRIKK